MPYGTIVSLPNALGYPYIKLYNFYIDSFYINSLLHYRTDSVHERRHSVCIMGQFMRGGIQCAYEGQFMRGGIQCAYVGQFMRGEAFSVLMRQLAQIKPNTMHTLCTAIFLYGWGFSVSDNSRTSDIFRSILLLSGLTILTL